MGRIHGGRENKAKEKESRRKGNKKRGTVFQDPSTNERRRAKL